jgi:hypothetical protein
MRLLLQHNHELYATVWSVQELYFLRAQKITRTENHIALISPRGSRYGRLGGPQKRSGSCCTGGGGIILCQFIAEITSIYLWLYSACGPWPLFQFLKPYTVVRTPWTGDQPVARPLSTHRTTQIQNKRTHTSMPLVGFNPTIPVFQQAKTFHALDHTATVIGVEISSQFQN